MEGDVLELVDRLWRGEVDITSVHPVGGFVGELCEPREGVAFVPSFANVSAFATDDGLALVDTGSTFLAASVHGELRKWSPLRLDTAVYSHGHIDHVFGVGVFEEEATANGWQAPVVVAHEALPARFDRYVATAGYNSIINQRQFGVPGLRWPTEYRYPDRTYTDRLDLDVGGLRLELHHARGETDDHTWTWVPQLRVLCCGDLFIWASPNAGNPQKVQRYPREWAAALREMVALSPEVLLPGHGFPVVGPERVRQALTETADLLDSLVDQTLALMNAGARLDEVVHEVRAPAALLERPYLRPVYDEPEFVVRNVWRQYGGWWDGNPSTLKPAPEALVASQLAELAGGAGALADRALSLAASVGGPEGHAGRYLDVPDSLRLAAHLSELAALAAPEDAGVQRVRAEVYSRCAEIATSTMAKGVFNWASRESRERAAGGG
ncbi:MAG TPA: alkyl sulfatase dimerization domain-containing protein [Acidimicrobiales bacterium]|nr:alkyl sulfatase dimerization domain-containing protein [Acidimicrobiales bacterium]